MTDNDTLATIPDDKKKGKDVRPPLVIGGTYSLKLTTLPNGAWAHFFMIVSKDPKVGITGYGSFYPHEEAPSIPFNFRAFSIWINNIHGNDGAEMILFDGSSPILFQGGPAFTFFGEFILDSKKLPDTITSLTGLLKYSLYSTDTTELPAILNGQVIMR